MNLRPKNPYKGRYKKGEHIETFAEEAFSEGVDATLKLVAKYLDRMAINAVTKARLLRNE